MNDPFSLPKGKTTSLSSEKGSLELKTQEFMPTILIGLGGTGKEVLLRIRRQFVEKYGSIDNFPITSYLYIDTDNAPSEESGIARERDYLINDIDFQPSEKIFNPVNPSDYINRINDVPHIKKWLNFLVRALYLLVLYKRWRSWLSWKLPTKVNLMEASRLIWKW